MMPEAHKDKEVPEESGTKNAPVLPQGTHTPPVMPAGKPVPNGKAEPAEKSAPVGKPAPTAKPVAGAKRTWKFKALVGGVAAVVLLGAGTAFGTTLPDPSTSEQYVALQESKAGVDGKLETLKGDYSTLEGIYLTLKDTVEERAEGLDEREKAAADVEKANAEAAAAVKKREEAVTGAEAKKAKNTISDGTWTVGRNIEPGTYMTTEQVGSSCYWAILASGTNGSDIIENDIPGGGLPSVTLSAGQDFNTKRCGSWTKQ